MKKVLLVLLVLVVEVFGQGGRPPPSNLNQIPVRNFGDLQNLPTSLTPFVGNPDVRGKTKSVAFAPRTDGKVGSGTEEDPFNATSYDSRLAAYKAANVQNLDIHLIGSGYQTNVATSGLGSGFYVNSNWRIHGDGMYVTTVTMVGSMAGQHYDHEAFKAPQNVPADNVTISDLTIDSNFSALNASADTVNSESDYVAYGVGINGSNNTIERVRVINQYGTFANGGESFGIALGAATSGSTGAVIRFCVVEQPHGTYAGSPFAIGGADTTHLMKQFRVYGNYVFGINDGIISATFNTGGVNLAFVQNGEIYDNFFVDCRGFVYCDTGNVDKVSFKNNTTIRAWQGVGFVSDEVGHPSWTKTNLAFSGNSVNIQDRNNGEVSAFRFAGGTGIQIVGTNAVSTSTGGSGAGLQYWTVLAQGVTNMSVMDLCGPNEHAQVSGTAITKKRNFTPAGASIIGLEDNQFFTIIANAVLDGDMRVQGEFASTTAYNAQPVAGVLFANKYKSDGSLAGMGGIGVGKLNNTDSNSSSYLALYTRHDGDNTTEHFRMFDQGGVALDSTTNPGTGNLLLGGLTPSEYVKTDASKILVSTSTIPSTDVTGLGTVAILNTGTSAGNIPLLDGSGKIPSSELPATATTFKGVWNANTNSPTITSSTGTTGWFYVINTAGTTTIDGISSWAAGDQIIFDGSVWQKVPAASLVTSVAGRIGAVTITAADVTDGTTVGRNVLKLTNPSALGYVRINADNTTTFRSTANTKVDLSLNSVANVDVTAAIRASSSPGTTVYSTRTFALYDEVNDDDFIQANNGSLDFKNFPAVTFGVGEAAIFRNGLGLGSIVLQSDTGSSTTLQKGNGTGGFSSAVASTDYIAATSGSAIQKANGSGGLTSAVASTDYIAATSGSAIQKANSGGLVAAVTGTDFVGVPVVTTVAFGSTVTPAVGTTGNTTTYVIGALTNNIIIGAPTGTPVDGQILKFRFVQDGTGSHSVTWNSAFVFGTDITAAMEPMTASAIWRRAFEWNAATSKWECTGLVRGF